MNRNTFIFKPNLYKDYYVNFSNGEKHLIGILGYLNEFEICIIHKGVKVPSNITEVSGYVKRRAQNEKIEFNGKVALIENKSHKNRNYTFIWLIFSPPISLSERLIAIEMANFSEEEN